MKFIKLNRRRDFFYLWNPKVIYPWLLKNYLVLKNPKLSKDNAIRIMKQNWDYLIILDACRYDVFKLFVHNDAKPVISGGSCTQEWLEWNFKGEFKDVVYIAGNPYFSNFNLIRTFGFNPFYKVLEVWDYGWDKKFKTVHPKTLTEEAIKVLEKYPNKRMIIHYNQPHHPFLTNQKLIKIDSGAKKYLNNYKKKDKISAWRAAKKGIIPVREVFQAYIDNLLLVMQYVNQIVEKLQGKVILTSDHGEQVGEYMLFGHAFNYRTEELVVVPWYIAKNTKREIFDRDLLSYQEKEDLEKHAIHRNIQFLFKDKEFGKKI
ncbi:MAG: sulfatase-like hydrolase/transferase [Candidatus Thorarchaeota archaeon]